MTSKRQLRAELAAAEATVDALRIKLAAANEDRDLAEISLAEARGKLRSTTTVLADAVRRREAKAAKADTQTAKEWEAAKEGRSLRGPDGRWLKTDTDKEHP